MSKAWERVPEYNIGSSANYATRNRSIVRGLAYHRRVYKKLAAWCESHPNLGFDFVEEPWLREVRSDSERCKMCQPDAVLLDNITGGAIIVEAKLNWKDGRDEKLINLYLQAAASAFGVSTTWPLLVTSNIRGYRGEPLRGLKEVERVFEWRPGVITPVMLLI